MSAAGARPDHWDDIRRNHHRCSVRAFSWTNKCGALDVVYSDGSRLWLDARGFALDYGGCHHACRLQSQLVSLCLILIIGR